ncbi:MAG: ATP-binding cassette domain-containing protein [Chitinophagaceae bacterium]|nr:ATP-binding cassette domain-containing protein [Chitinophagaceae bacterium]
MPPKMNPVARILNLVKLERKEIMAIYFYAVLNGLIQLSLPLGIQAIISYVLGASMRASLVILISLVVAGVLAVGLMQVNQMKIIEKIQQKIFVRYAFAFATHIPRLDLKKNDAVYLPELVNRFFEVPVLQKSLSKILLDIPTATIQILFGLILLSFYHPAFILFGSILVLVLWLILRYTGSSGLETSLNESSYKYKVAGWLEEIARVIKSMKLARKNDMHLKKTDEYVIGYLDSKNNHFRILLFQYHVLVIFKTVITAAMLIVGTMLMINQQLTIGQFIAAEIVILLVLNSVEKLIMNLGTVYDTLTSVEKVAKLTDKPVEDNGTLELPANGKGLKLEMQNVSFGFSPQKNILHNIDLLIQPGEKISITGKESSGKSTLLRLMTGIYTDFAGAILLDDIPLGNYELASIRAQTGILLNQQDIFQGTIWENITLGNESIKKEYIVELANRTGLSEYINGLKEGYDTPLDPTGNRLARNVIHKILLVRALASNPRLLLLEDPWNNMAETYRQQVMDLLLGLKDTTVVVVNNDNQFINQCTKIIHLEDGRIQTIQ